MAQPRTSIDDTITARCTKCRKNTSHLVLSLLLEAPDQVQCTQCHRQHAYRPPTGAKASTDQLNQRQKAAESREWEKLRPAMDPAKAKVYSMSGTFRVNSLVEHASFGIGLVQRSIGSHKIEVLFSAGKKIMCCRAT